MVTCPWVCVCAGEHGPIQTASALLPQVSRRRTSKNQSHYWSAVWVLSQTAGSVAWQWRSYRPNLNNTFSLLNCFCVVRVTSTTSWATKDLINTTDGGAGGGRGGSILSSWPLQEPRSRPVKTLMHQKPSRQTTSHSSPFLQDDVITSPTERTNQVLCDKIWSLSLHDYCHILLIVSSLVSTQTCSQLHFFCAAGVFKDPPTSEIRLKCLLSHSSVELN